MQHTSIIALAALTLLAGCAAMGGGRSGLVQPIGKDSFTVRYLSPKSVSDAKQQSLAQANAHCGQSKRNVQVVREESGTEETGEKYYDLTFYCLPQGDADYVRFKPQAANPQPQE